MELSEKDMDIINKAIIKIAENNKIKLPEESNFNIESYLNDIYNDIETYFDFIGGGLNV